MAGRKLRVHEHEVEITSSPKDVWRALTDRTEIARWVGWEADHTASWIDEVFVDNVTASKEQSYLLLGDRASHFIEFFCESPGETTRLRMVHSGEREGSDWDAIYDGEYVGWRGYLANLRHCLERHPGTPKRTFHLGAMSDLGAEDAFAKVLRGLGGGEELARRAPGAAFSMTTAGGDPLVGTVRERPVGRTRLVLEIGNLNDALLHIVAGPIGQPVRIDEDGVVDADRSTYPSVAGRPAQTLLALVLNTWGVDDAVYEGVRDRSALWFGDLFPRT